MVTAKLELQSILEKFRILIKFLVSSKQVEEHSDVLCVPINQCRHYCGFRYGTQSFNPYENYIVGLHQGKKQDALRQQFVNFLRYYRPRNFGEVFNIKLSRHIPLWVYPWQEGDTFDTFNGWLRNIDDVPDIITHFCEQGIKRSRIEEEFFWLERALTTIATQGYQPESFGYITVFELKKADDSVYVVSDGNHRLSALVALGQQEVLVKRRGKSIVYATDYLSWYQVQKARYSAEDALALFNIYSTGVLDFSRSPTPAKILEGL